MHLKLGAKPVAAAPLTLEAAPNFGATSPSSRSPAPKEAKPPKAKKERFRLTYLRADGSPWKSPKPKTDAQKARRQRYIGKTLPARRDAWVDKVCAMFVDVADGARAAAMAFAEAHKSDVHAAFEQRRAKANAVEALLEIYVAIP